jgi:hypothetical protein
LLAVWHTAALNIGRRTPRTGLAVGEPDDRLLRGIQYAAASRLNHWRLWNTGSPGPGFAKALPCWRAEALAKAASRAMTTGGALTCPRHCERSEAIHSFFARRNGLLRFARHDGLLHYSANINPRSRGVIRPSFERNLPPSGTRAQGRPGARCTRGLVCSCAQEVRTRAYRSSGEHPAFPAQWFYGLWRALLGERAFLPPSPHG